MAIVIQWEDHMIELVTKPKAKYAFLAFDTEVWVDGVKKAESGGFKFNESVTGVINNKGREVPFRSQLNAGFWIPNYEFYIEDELIDRGKVDVSIWILIPILLLAILFGAIVGGGVAYIVTEFILSFL